MLNSNFQLKCSLCISEFEQMKTVLICKRCYPIYMRINAVKKWNYKNPTTLKNGYIGCNSIEKFAKFKENYLHFLQEIIDREKRENEQIQNKNVDGLDIEYQLSKLASLMKNKISKAKFGVFHGYCNKYNFIFTIEQKVLIYSDLINLERLTRRDYSPVSSYYR